MKPLNLTDMEKNIYMECAELEQSLNRNQRDVLDFAMYWLDTQNGMNIDELLLVMKYIKNKYDGMIRMSDEEIHDFWIGN